MIRTLVLAMASLTAAAALPMSSTAPFGSNRFSYETNEIRGWVDLFSFFTFAPLQVKDRVNPLTDRMVITTSSPNSIIPLIPIGGIVRGGRLSQADSRSGALCDEVLASTARIVKFPGLRYKFGAYVRGLYAAPTSMVIFQYRRNNQVVATQVLPVYATQSAWTWNGHTLTSDGGFDEVRILSANNQNFALDDIVYW